MPAGAVLSTSLRFVAAAAVASLALVGCTDDGSDDAGGASSAHAESVAALTALLPADARGAFAVDLGTLRSGGSSDDITALLEGGGADPAFGEVFAAIGTLATSVDAVDAITSAVLAQTTDPADGLLLLATARPGTVEEDAAGSEPGEGNRLALLPDDVVVIGRDAAVASVLDISEGDEPAEASAIAPFLEGLDGGAHLSFAYGLPALFDDDVPADRTLQGAAAVSGALDVADGDLAGSMAFHTSNAAEFVEAYNELDRNASGGEEPLAAPLALADPIVEDLGQVVVTLPPSPIDASSDDADEVVASRNLAKKLFVGMDAHDHAEGVGDPDAENEALVDLLVKSEEDEETPPSPGSVFIRWEFRDQAAIDAFEANELPAGFSLTPLQFFESDDPEGGYFLALNLYNSGGGSIVNGMRAEWDVFVEPPAGADPDAGERPRFMIVDALGEAVSADPLNLVTPAEPLSHSFVDGAVVSSVGRLEDDREVPVFESSFPKPDPDEAEVARFTREMAIANDYIYWPNGVLDRVVYNATTFNHDAYFVDPAEVTIRDDSRWAQYLKPNAKDVVYYVNTLEYVASPMANLDSEHLDVTPEWLAELSGFKDNGHQLAFMRGAVQQLFLGKGDALVPRHITNETPSTYYHFEIADPDALAAAIDLPDGLQLAPMELLEGDEAGNYLTLSVYEIDDAIEGTRAEWSVYVDDGSGRPHQRVVELMTAEVGLDPVGILDLPSDVRHSIDDGVLSTQLSSASVTFDASFETAGASDEELSLDWIESGDEVCSANGICDLVFYDAETLDVPVHRALDVTVNEFSSPWGELVSETPAMVFYRDNAQEYAVKRWHNLKVPVDLLPVAGLEDGTHTISGSGSLVGRTSDVVDSDYTYTGDALVEGNLLTFSIDQRVENALGTSNIYTAGSFDLTTGQGSQAVVDCRGPDLMCSDIERGSSQPYTAQELDAFDPDAIAWQVNLELDLGGSFGIADSAATFLATRTD